MSLTEPPTKLCCGQRHWGAVCPDGTVWCCVCFGHFTEDELFEDDNGNVWDICKECQGLDGIA